MEQARRIAGYWFAALLFVAGQTQADAPKVGDKFGDWIFACKALGPEKTVCAIVQNIDYQTEQVQKRLLTLTVRRLQSPESKTSKTILLARLPLGIFLPSGVAARIDETEQFPMFVQTCSQMGCEAVVELDKQKLRGMKAGKKLFIGFKVQANSKVVTIPASLIGFSKGIAVLK